MNKYLAVLYICTGPYKCFWKDFYLSSEEHFFPEVTKHYFVFTDSENLEFKNDSKITIIDSPAKGFPLDSLFRFEMFLKIEKMVREYEYAFFFNSNMLFLQKVDKEIFPHDDYKGLIGVIHPRGYKYRNLPCMFTYERNSASLAYIKKENKKYNYFMGGVNGGSVNEYFELIKKCSKNIQEDYQKNIIAIYHDESHLNKFFSECSVHALSTAYGYPEGAKLPFDPKIIIRDKRKIDLSFDKHKGEGLIKKSRRYLNQIYSALTW